MSKIVNRILVIALLFTLIPLPIFAQAPVEPETPDVEEVLFTDVLPALGGSASPLAATAVTTITLMHTNDFHGNLEPAEKNPGIARLAAKIKEVRAAAGEANTLLLDAGDIMQSTLISNLFKGESTIDLYNFIGYDVATLGNHEFDWGQQVLVSRTLQAEFPFVAANLVTNDTGDCATSGWNSPAWAKPWITKTVGTAPNQIVVGLVGVTSQETPYITIASATNGLCFKDAALSVSHYYSDVVNAGADIIVVLSHLGNADGGYGYGIPVYGDGTLATRLQAARTPVHMIIGGHSHTDLSAAQNFNGTVVVQAHYAGRKLGRADIGVDPSTNAVTINWQRITVATTDPQDADTLSRLSHWTNNAWYQEQINRVVGFTNVDITRNYNGDSLMGAFVNDAIYNDLNSDATTANDVDMVFNNAGGLRTDIIIPPMTVKVPYTLTHGILYSVLPFGNQTAVGDMTGAQILDLLNQSATLFKGALQVGGVRYTFYRYSDAQPGPQPWAWGAYDIEVYNSTGKTWEPLVMTETYRVATNEFLAPAGQDGFVPFKYMTNITYWGDMLDGVERWVAKTYGTPGTAYAGALDGRITRAGTDSEGPVVPVTILHHNDSHGNLAKGAYVGYTQLATLIKQERLHNPTRTLLLNGGDQIQGDAMMYYYKSAFSGKAADGTTLPVTLTTHPLLAAMNVMTYTAMTLGNHEFNFGNYVFTGTLKQANFPLLQANLYDDGRYGIEEVGVQPHIVTTLGDIKVAILGIGNHRVPNYELPSNIPGLKFTNPITEAQARVPALNAANDVVIALTHIGFTGNPKSVEVDSNVDTNLAAQTNGIDAIIGAHSHTDPSKQTDSSGAYKYLPAIVGSPDNTPVIINHAYRYNNTLGEVVLGLLPKQGGGYEVVSRAGRYIKVDMATVEDAQVKAIVNPYLAFFKTYNEKIIAKTTKPINAVAAFTEETNGANLQADAAVWEMAQHGIDVDFHLSGAMSDKKIADSAAVTNPYTLTIANMFTLMPYENSLVALKMNGPQLKAVLERSYRNYYYYKHTTDAGGYSKYTTCFLDPNQGGQIKYNDTYPALPNGNNVLSFSVNGQAIDFLDATKFYTVSTVNYLAAGSCNFNNNGVSLWPLDEDSIVADTQYYVRDAVINYATAMQTISPTIEGRIQFIYLNQIIHMPVVLRAAQ